MARIRSVPHSLLAAAALLIASAAFAQQPGHTVTCNDGTTDNSARKSPCSGHGGIKPAPGAVQVNAPAGDKTTAPAPTAAPTTAAHAVVSGGTPSVSKHTASTTTMAPRENTSPATTKIIGPVDNKNASPTKIIGPLDNKNASPTKIIGPVDNKNASPTKIIGPVDNKNASPTKIIGPLDNKNASPRDGASASGSPSTKTHTPAATQAPASTAIGGGVETQGTHKTGATAHCADGSYSTQKQPKDQCVNHGGVAKMPVAGATP